MSDAPRADAIEPTRFAPTPEPARRRLRALSPGRIGLLVGAAALAWFLWFLFTAKAVRFDIHPADAAVTVSGGFEIRFSGSHLLRQGAYDITATAPGHQPLQTTVRIGEPRSQAFEFRLTPLPGSVTFESLPAGAEVRVDGVAVGVTPLTVELAAGSRAVEMALPLHQPASVTVEVQGKSIAQTVVVPLQPDWASVTLPTRPPGAALHVDGVVAGVSPGPVRVPAGERRMEAHLDGYKVWRDILQVTAGQPVNLPAVDLVAADGTLLVRSTPPQAGVTVNGEYRGLTPARLDVAAGATHQVRVLKAGYATARREVRVGSNRRAAMDFELQALTGELAVTVEPEDAELWIDGERIGLGNRTVALSAAPHDVELRLNGYAGYRRTVTPQPGFTQQLKVRLLTLEEARFARLTPRIQTSVGQELVLLKPTPIRLGASRREPGRRANETLRDVALAEFFYLGAREVTNAEFRQFAPGHASGEFETVDLNKDDQPAVNVSWEEAALYCNWLSQREELPPFYTVEFGKVTGFAPNGRGYRLPAEAEWAWAARHVGTGEPLLRFPWGERLPPPPRHGNYADAAARHVVGRIIFGYNDNHIGSAPVSTFKPNDKGLYDMGGNVAEWMHDYYDIPEPEQPAAPLGPPEGEYHVIKGASWMHGAVSELRLSFRDYGAKGRNDVGFRIARFAEGGYGA